MNSKTVDIKNLAIDDLFRAKERRRSRLARLPFEQKIAILRKLQTIPAALHDEKLIFDSFLKACPEFAEEIREWDVVEHWYGKRGLAAPLHPFDRRPDIIAITTSGRKVGVELKSWVNREQIAAARREERIRENILKAIGEQPLNRTKHIGYIWLKAKEARFDSRDTADFRHQLFRLIDQVDADWTQGADEERNKQQDIKELGGFPTLEKYLEIIRFVPASRRRLRIRWITFPSPGGHYSPNEMRETLRRALLTYKNDVRYKDLRQKAKLDEIYLLVHYDFKAFAYNTPFDSPDFDFKEAAKFASTVLNGDASYFDGIFLFRFLWGKEEAYRIA